MLICKKIARAPGGHKRFMLTKLGGGGGGGGQNRSDFSMKADFSMKVVGDGFPNAMRNAASKTFSRV